MTLAAAIACHRFGLGPRPGELARASDPGAWLEPQIDPALALLEDTSLPTTADAIQAEVDMRSLRRQKQRGETAALEKSIRKGSRAQRARLLDDIKARMSHAVTTKAPFAERWVRFWSNHFTVAATRGKTVGLTGPFEREAIRPHVFGTFADLLEASTFHPGMLLYLDNERSVGPSTRLARRRKLGLNENLAREILELHTLGVDGGYTQADVESLAKALTGWQPVLPYQSKLAALATPYKRAVFMASIHEPGAKRLLGKRYETDGIGQARAMLADLATHRATAHHVATKVARHFLADAPPHAAVQALELSFLDSSGDLAHLARTLIRFEGAFDAPQSKFKTPDDLLIAAARALGPDAAFGRARAVIASFAQQPYGAPSPAGWPDTQDHWLSPDALEKRADWASGAARRASISAEHFVEIALGPLASAPLRTHIARAGSPAQALTLALMSPAFQRR